MKNDDLYWEDRPETQLMIRAFFSDIARLACALIALAFQISIIAVGVFVGIRLALYVP
jgi:hypothetical protein